MEVVEIIGKSVGHGAHGELWGELGERDRRERFEGIGIMVGMEVKDEGMELVASFLHAPHGSPIA